MANYLKVEQVDVARELRNLRNHADRTNALFRERLGSRGRPTWFAVNALQEFVDFVRLWDIYDRIASEKPRTAVSVESGDIAALICRDVAELPDRTSPDDWPDAMLVTAEELQDIVRGRILQLEAEKAIAQTALEEVCACMLNGGDGATGDYGWIISRLTKARPMIREALRRLTNKDTADVGKPDA